ncbi:hypothetical protein BN971_01408 [Mycobacterium bohemicum DSM 44277]|uniref:Uncharacterized protein n=1 Tax=Mycobacterium bohemicum DSM 44277 TaxID=1236609 RepID=A0A0U0W629_MYCBE|nr:hypothetical protein [Mycobacterium bohemicum]CPR08983.1 hypothetical protein BN971_01408 [Mycobacterium bohemicum DSM 44277]
MKTWSKSPSVRSGITKLMLTGALIAIPMAPTAVGGGVPAMPAGTPNASGPYAVLPADPPSPVPPPPAPPAPAQYNTTGDYYCGSCDGGGGGGGGG